MTTEQIYSIFLSSSGISTDSRNVSCNQLFIALKGEAFNGNLYAEIALEKGCSYAIVDETDVVKSEKYILVKDSLKCLQELAYLHRQSFHIPVIAITGSNGKTTTKELIKSVLEKRYTIHSTKGNLNNHIGVPLTLLSMKSPEIAIIEMGANHPGEITELCTIADPNYGIITNIGKAHMEGFGSFEGVKKTKSELYRYLDAKEASIFINGENTVLTELSDNLRLKRISYFSGNNVQCNGFVINNNPLLEISIQFAKRKKWEISTHLTGKYNLENILAAAAIGKYFGIAEIDIINAIEEYIPDNNRSQIIKTESNTLILDAYNANPSSMKEALKNLADIETTKKMVILGDMLELGSYAANEHVEILNMLREMNIETVYLVGPEFYKWKKDFDFIFFTNIDELKEHLENSKIINQLVLLKGSRLIQLEKAIKVL